MSANTTTKKASSRTRDALLGAGVQLLAERSIHEVSVDDIVNTANVAKGSFYNYFRDKEEFADDIATQLNTALINLVEAMNEGVEDPAMRIARGVSFAMLSAHSNKPIARILMRANATITDQNHPANAGIRADISSGIKSGRFDLSTTEAGVLAAMGITRIGAVRVVQNTYARESIANLAQQLATNLLRGLGVELKDARAVTAQAVEDIILSA